MRDKLERRSRRNATPPPSDVPGHAEARELILQLARALADKDARRDHEHSLQRQYERSLPSKGRLTPSRD